MKEGWEVRKLGEVMVVERGGSPRPIKKYLTDDEDGINWIKISDATASNKYIYETKQKITADGLHKTRMVNPGDFILSNSMSFGRPYIMKTSGCIHDGWLVLRVKEDFELDKDFLYHLLCSPNLFSQFDNLAAGSTVRNLNIGLVKSVEILLPPLPEQKKIVRFLDRAFADIDAARANIERNLENARELFQSRLNEFFSETGKGFAKQKMNELCEIKSKLVNPQENEYLELLHVGGGNIVSETGELVNLKTSEEEGLKSGKFHFDKSVVLYNKIRPYLVKVARPDFEGLCSADMYPLTPKAGVITRDYLYFLLISEKFTDYANAGSARAAMPKVNRKHLFAFECQIPSLEKQKEILSSMNDLMVKIEEVKDIYRHKLQNLENLKKSLLERAFAGELT